MSVSEKITINAELEVVLDAIRQLRNIDGRKQESFDGKVAVVNEELENVPVFGKVHCVWQETELSPHKIEFKMLKSSKFKASHGAYILSTPSAGRTALEIQVHMDAGLAIPFAAEMTKSNTSKDTKLRLEKIKKLAENLQQTQQNTA